MDAVGNMPDVQREASGEIRATPAEAREWAGAIACELLGGRV